jgi:hypothetical protein
VIDRNTRKRLDVDPRLPRQVFAFHRMAEAVIGENVPPGDVADLVISADLDHLLRDFLVSAVASDDAVLASYLRMATVNREFVYSFMADTMEESSLGEWWRSLLRRRSDERREGDSNTD